MSIDAATRRTFLPALRHARKQLAMTRIYQILGWAGWVWAAIFFSCLGIRAWRQRRIAASRGFPVIKQDEHER